MSEYHWQSKEYEAEKSRRHYEKKRAWLWKIKDVPCMDCGGRFPPECMDFDHIRGEKLFSVSTSVTRERKSLIEEIAKCDIICANCHRIRTRSRL